MMLVILLFMALAITFFWSEETRDAQNEILCPGCSKHISPNHQFCPHCRFSVKVLCPRCGKGVNWDWRQCPHCSSQLGEGDV